MSEFRQHIPSIVILTCMAADEGVTLMYSQTGHGRLRAAMPVVPSRNSALAVGLNATRTRCYAVVVA